MSEREDATRGQLRIVGVGNRDRGDDGVGPRVAERLRQSFANGSASVFEGDTMELLDLWDGPDTVILIDAMVSGRPAGTVECFDARAEPLPEHGFPTSTHALGLAQAVELARSLDRLPAVLWIYGIEAAQVEEGAGLSTEVEAAATKVVEDIRLALSEAGLSLPPPGA